MRPPASLTSDSTRLPAPPSPSHTTTGFGLWRLDLRSWSAVLSLFPLLLSLVSKHCQVSMILQYYCKMCPLKVDTFCALFLRIFLLQCGSSYLCASMGEFYLLGKRLGRGVVREERGITACWEETWRWGFVEAAPKFRYWCQITDWQRVGAHKSLFVVETFTELSETIYA